MSTLAVNTITDSSGGNTAKINSMTPTADSLQGFRNRIINGDMRIDQRNSGASVTIGAATVTYTLDRWLAYGTLGSKFSVQQNAASVSTPSGFTNYAGITSLAATTPSANDEYVFQQRIEGFNLSDLNWGTANAQSISLSFRVYSSLTGTFGGAIVNSAQNRCYVFSYSITSSNTWTAINTQIPGDTTGTWVTNNGIGARLVFDLGGGTTFKGAAGSWGSTQFDGVTGGINVIGTNGATWYITGVQLEAGSVATNFERRPYGTELALCQRYYETAQFVGYNYFGGAGAGWNVLMYPFKVEKRASPIIAFSGMSYSNCSSIVASQITTSGLNATVTASALGGGSAPGTFTASSEL